MTKDEIEKLLRHGAYDIFNEEKTGSSEKESNDFIEQDIDSILERRTKTVIHENTGSKSNAAGGTFSKASFKSMNAGTNETGDVDVDDPDFWKKVVGEAKAEKLNDLLGKKRKQAKTNYNERDYERQIEAHLGDGVFMTSDVTHPSKSCGNPIQIGHPSGRCNSLCEVLNSKASFPNWT